MASAALLCVAAYRRSEEATGKASSGVLPVRAAEMALPALPLVLFVVEGYVEPHAKEFTGCDFLARLSGVLALALLAGAASTAVWHGAILVLETLLWPFRSPGKE